MKRVGLLSLMWMISGCSELVAPTVEQNTNLVKVLPEPKVEIPGPPAAEVYVPSERLEEALPPPKVKLIFVPTLSTEPPETTQVGLLREVRLSIDVQGLDPSALAVEFVAPEGNVFNRQVKQLNQKRTVRQQVDFTLPVAGSLIASSNLVGTWQAHVFHNDVEVAALSFEVTP